MRLNHKLQKAILRLLTARSWPQRLAALLVLVIAGYSWYSQPAEAGSMAAGQQISGEIVAVADGDTVTLLDARRKEYKLRLAFIDAPEKAMPFGQAAKQALSDLVYRQQVVAEITDVDRYGRGVALIRREGQDINLAQLSAGYAWHYRQYAAKAQSGAEFATYAAATAAAKSAALGLWQQANPVPPWDWRRQKRES